VFYFRFQDQGTGEFGPRQKPIVPVRAQALFWKGARHPVKSVRGTKAKHYIRDTHKQLSKDAVKIAEKETNAFIAKMEARAKARSV